MRIIAIVMTILMILSAGAAYAAPGEMDSPLLTTYDLIAAADKQMENVKSFEADINFKLALNMDGEKATADTKLAMKFMLDPLTAKLDLDMATKDDTNSHKANMEAYLRNEDGDVALYLYQDGEAVRVSVTTALGAVVYSLYEYVDSVEASYEKLAYVGESTINGRSVYIIEAKPKFAPDKEAIESILDSLAEGTVMQGFAASGTLLAMKKIAFTCYIDKETYQYVRIEADLAGAAGNLFSELDIESENSFYGFNVERYSLSIDFKNINKVKKFDVPQSIVKEAEKNEYSDKRSERHTSIYDAEIEEIREYYGQGYDEIDWKAVTEMDEADFDKYIVGDDFDYDKLAKDFPRAK